MILRELKYEQKKSHVITFDTLLYRVDRVSHFLLRSVIYSSPYSRYSTTLHRNPSRGQLTQEDSGQTIVLFTGQWAPVINYHQLLLFTPVFSVTCAHKYTRHCHPQHREETSGNTSFFRLSPLSNDVPRKNNTNPTRCFGIYGGNLSPSDHVSRLSSFSPIFFRFFLAAATQEPPSLSSLWPTETRLCVCVFFFYLPREGGKNWLNALIAMTPSFSVDLVVVRALEERISEHAIKSTRLLIAAARNRCGITP